MYLVQHLSHKPYAPKLKKQKQKTRKIYISFYLNVEQTASKFICRKENAFQKESWNIASHLHRYKLGPQVFLTLYFLKYYNYVDMCGTLSC